MTDDTSNDAVRQSPVPPQVPLGVALSFGVVPTKPETPGHTVTYNWTLDQSFDCHSGAESYYWTLKSCIFDEAQARDGSGAQALDRADLRIATDILGESATVAYTDPDTGARITAHFAAVG